MLSKYVGRDPTVSPITSIFEPFREKQRPRLENDRLLEQPNRPNPGASEAEANVDTDTDLIVLDRSSPLSGYGLDREAVIEKGDSFRSGLNELIVPLSSIRSD